MESNCVMCPVFLHTVYCRVKRGILHRICSWGQACRKQCRHEAPDSRRLLSCVRPCRQQARMNDGKATVVVAVKLGRVRLSGCQLGGCSCPRLILRSRLQASRSAVAAVVQVRVTSACC